MIYSLILLICLSLLTYNILETLISNHDDNIIFLLLCIIILNTTFILFWKYFNNLSISLITSLLLMVITYILVLELRIYYKKNIKYALPYFILCIYNFAKIIDLFLDLAHQ